VERDILLSSSVIEATRPIEYGRHKQSSLHSKHVYVKGYKQRGRRNSGISEDFYVLVFSIFLRGNN